MGIAPSRWVCRHRRIAQRTLPNGRPYVFDLSDESHWLAQLRDHGFVVIRGVATPVQVSEAKGLLWDAIEKRFAADRQRRAAFDLNAEKYEGQSHIIFRVLPRQQTRRLKPR
jgi:hypothetical protein